MFAYHLMQEGQRVVLLDLDLSRGGMDILLGLEQDEGLRWSGIDAPLGMIDGPALIREMLQWDGCPVLSADTWCAAPHQWWGYLPLYQLCVHRRIQSYATAALIPLLYGGFKLTATVPTHHLHRHRTGSISGRQ